MGLDARPLETSLSPRHTLLVLPNWVGDTVMALPVAEALAASGRRLTALARPHLESLLGLVPAIGDVLVRSHSNPETIAAIRGRGFDEAVVLPNSFRSAWLVFRAGVPVRWGYRGDLRGALLHPSVVRPPGSRHQITDYDALLAELGAEPVRPLPRITLPAERAEQAASHLRDSGIRPDPPSAVGVFPGAEFGPSKRWPPSRFATLIRHLRDRGLQPVVIAGPAERPLAREVAGADGAVPIVGPGLDLAELAAVLGRLRFLITNDSGPMHLAAAMGVPCIALFGPTDPARTAPAGAGHHVLSRGRWCAPCFRKRCPLLHQRCLKEITVEDVANAVDRALASSQPIS